MKVQFKGVKAKMFMLIYKFVEVHDGLYCGNQNGKVVFCFEDTECKNDFINTLIGLNLINVTYESLDDRQVIMAI